MSIATYATPLRQLHGFGLVGLVGLVVNLAVTAFARNIMKVGVEVAYLMGYAGVLLIGFALCRHFVFKSTDRTPGAQLIAFIISSTVFRGLEYGASLSLHFVFSVNYLLAIIFVAPGAFLLKFTFYRSYIFTKS